MKLEFSIVNDWYPEGKTSYNAVAEIPGTDNADEIVMLGGYLDSWHSATGATDNAIGSSMMMWGRAHHPGAGVEAASDDSDRAVVG